MGSSEEDYLAIWDEIILTAGYLAEGKKRKSQPVSRVLSWTVIPLGRMSPRASSNLPESSAGHANGFLFGLAPSGVFQP